VKQAELLQLVDRVYEASLEPGRWDAALSSVARHFDGTASGIRIQNGAYVSQLWVGLEPSFEEAYLEHYALLDPWVPAALSRPAGRCYTSQELVDDDELERSTFYNELCKPHGMRELCGGFLELSGSLMVSMSVMRRDGAPRFDARAAKAMNELTPHMRRALAIQRRLRTGDGTTAWAALDGLPIAVVTLDRGGRIHRTNRRADELIARRDGLVSEQGTLGALAPHDTRKLAGFVKGLVSPLDPKAPREPVVRIERGGEKRPLAIVGVRITRESAPAWELHHGGEPEVLLAIAVDDSVSGPPAELLRQLYGLTPAEARVAIQVGMGKSPREVSDELGIAWNTVRFQLRQVFEKMNVRRQSELTRVLLSLGCLPRVGTYS
jgi:DNA-binding CsgD family transcriptional regulator